MNHRFHALAALLLCVPLPAAQGTPAKGPRPNPAAIVSFAHSSPEAVVQSLSLPRFKQTIRTLASFGDRLAGSPSHDAAEAWIAQQLTSYGYAVEYHPFRQGGIEYRNLYVTKIGYRYPDRMYMISAHLDGRGGGGAADDDASGCALVLEAARAFAQVEAETSIRFVFWDNEEFALGGSSAYVSDRLFQRGVEFPPQSGLYPEPHWLGILQHDMILFDHGVPAQPLQSPFADLDIEYRWNSAFATESLALAVELQRTNEEFGLTYPAEIGDEMCCTDSEPFRNYTAALSIRENQRLAEIGQGSNPYWHTASDNYETYSEDDFRLGFDALRMSVGGDRPPGGRFAALRRGRVLTPGAHEGGRGSRASVVEVDSPIRGTVRPRAFGESESSRT